MSHQKEIEITLRDGIKWNIEDIKGWNKDEKIEFKLNGNGIKKDTFDIVAQKWSLLIANLYPQVTKHQIRMFYDKVLELEEQALNATKESFETEVLPFIKKLNAHVTYAKNRQQNKINIAFEKFMQQGINQSEDKTTFQNFVYLFEAIIGFYEERKEIKEVFNANRNKHDNKKPHGDSDFSLENIMKTKTANNRNTK
ncbi:type III-A CRISPR-associated protein Csm2 [Helicobacter cetorum]|uniref:type III-A CRISPR-associated protein Csm2 n=1 Tax=Helicobacter cetorum TaxID=138563 RepID=UPI000CF0C928|nr:type III-A CRISPR-associated protein Csm2 [Helicobacter cetorum]